MVNVKLLIGVLQTLQTLETDELIKHINLSNNINADETESPSKMRKLLSQLGIYFFLTKC